MTRDDDLAAGAPCNASELAMLRAARHYRDYWGYGLASELCDDVLRAINATADDPREPGRFRVEAVK